MNSWLLLLGLARPIIISLCTCGDNNTCARAFLVPRVCIKWRDFRVNEVAIRGSYPCQFFYLQLTQPHVLYHGSQYNAKNGTCGKISITTSLFWIMCCWGMYYLNVAGRSSSHLLADTIIMTVIYNHCVYYNLRTYSLEHMANNPWHTCSKGYSNLSVCYHTFSNHV